jgi:ATP phosphoribosyltransferase regulatory subunit
VRGTQLAPERQLPQAGIEVIGSDSIEADAEVAIVAVEALAAIGVAPVSLDVTLPSLTPILLDAAALAAPLRASLARALDRKDSAAVAAAVRDSGAAVLQALPALMAASGPAKAALAALQKAELPPAARALANDAASIIAAIARRAPGLRITLDPVEFRGFRYHTGVAFTLYGPGLGGELARGGRYVSHNGEPATGMTLYPDAVLRAAPRSAEPARLFVPLGADGAALRAEGFVTVAALSAEDTPESLRCSHVLQEGRAVALPRKG